MEAVWATAASAGASQLLSPALATLGEGDATLQPLPFALRDTLVASLLPLCRWTAEGCSDGPTGSADAGAASVEGPTAGPTCSSTTLGLTTTSSSLSSPVL